MNLFVNYDRDETARATYAIATVNSTLQGGDAETAKGMLAFEHAELILLNSSCASSGSYETAQGCNQRTYTNGRFALAKVFIIPSLSKPSDTLLQKYAAASKANLLAAPRADVDAVESEKKIATAGTAAKSKERWGKIRGSLAAHMQETQKPVFKVVKFKREEGKQVHPATAAKSKASWGKIRGSLGTHLQEKKPVLKFVKYTKPEPKHPAESKATSQGSGGKQVVAGNLAQRNPLAAVDVDAGAFEEVTGFDDDDYLDFDTSSDDEPGGSGSIYDEACSNLGNCTCANCR